MSAGYDAVKEFEGRKYSGMKIGGSHSWYYQQGEWKETKVAPDKWHFSYDVNKRRRWDAPEGSGAPVGIEYHWYILAHQIVRKLDANQYATSMKGTKYKLAHRRTAHGGWSASEHAQLRQLIAIFEESIIQLRNELGERSKGLRITPRNLPPGMTGQSPLEMYMAPVKMTE